MYVLSPRMLQKLERDLRKYHDLFSADRCSSWEMEELIVRAIKSDTQKQHHVQWKEAGHDDQADITVHTNGEKHSIQIKSGKWKAKRSTLSSHRRSTLSGHRQLTLSGHRLGRFNKNLEAISNYLNDPKANILSVTCIKRDNEQGRTFTYEICYIDIQYLVGLDPNQWQEKGKQYKQTNSYDVEFSLRPSMSWQIWWTIPEELIQVDHVIPIR